MAVASVAEKEIVIDFELVIAADGFVEFMAADGAIVSTVKSYSIGALTQPSGFVGADGWFALLADGQVRRALAVFTVERGGPQMLEPAPQSGIAPGV